MKRTLFLSMTQILLLASAAFTQGSSSEPSRLGVAACNPIPFDLPLCEALSNPGEEDCYTFTGAAGQRVTVFLDNQASNYLSLRLTKPDGTSWYCNFSYSDCEIDNVTLPATGEYTITIDGQGNATGNYCVVVNRLGDKEETIIYDQPRDAEISPMGDQDTFAFQGMAGQRVTVFLDNRASDYLSLRVTKPDGSSWFCDYNYSDCEIDNVALPATGEYIVTVNARGDGTGNYTVVANLLPPKEEMIIYDQPRDDGISPMGDKDTFAFQGTQGQHVTVFLNNNASDYLSLRVTKPDGSSWYCDYNYSDCEIDNVTLPATGEYIVTVDARGDGTGNYTVVANLLPPKEETIIYDQPYDRGISPMGDQDTFVFQGTQGQHVTVFLDNNASDYLSLRVTKPDGSSWYCDYNYSDCEIDNVTLPTTGEYIVTVDGSGDGTGNYTVVVNLLGDKREISYGQSLDDAIAPMGDQDNFIFDGGAGHRVTVFLQNRASGYMALRLYAPDGSLLRSCPFTYGNCEIRDVTLPMTGCYTAIVDGQGDDSGNYTITLNLLQGDPNAIAYDQYFDDELSPACDQDEFTFDGSAGHHITAYLRNLSGQLFALRLSAPNGSTIRYCDFTTGNCELDDVTLPANGRYSLIVDAKENAVGKYTLALSRVDGPVQLIGCGQSVNPAISIMGDRHVFNFSGKAEHRANIILRNHSSGRLSLRLTAPNGTTSQFCNFFSDSCAMESVLATPGTYTLTVDGEGATMGNYTLAFAGMDWATEPVSLNPPNQAREGDICPSGDEDRFFFDGKAGGHPMISLQNLSAVPLSLRLNNPDGTTLKLCDFTSSNCTLDTVLSQNGRYTVIVDGQNEATGSYRLSLTGTTSVAWNDENTLPAGYELAQNYPNPFNPTTVIRYALPKAAHVKLTIYDLIGTKVRILVEGTEAAGFKQTTWDATNDAGKRVPSGVYLYRLEAGEFTMTRKLTLMK